MTEEYGFTNLYITAGPAGGAAGYFAWKDIGYPVMYGDVYLESDYIPACASQCDHY